MKDTLIAKRVENVVLVSIKAEWGSDFQRDIHEESLKQVLKAWEDFASSRHKKNIIRIEIKRF